MRPSFSSKANYCKIAVSDGTFGPRGSVFMATWENVKMGGPWGYRPDGAAFSVWTTASNVVREGKGGKWAGMGYSTACAIGQGRLICASADYGLAEISLALPGDVTFNATMYSAGKGEYEKAGYRLTHGVDGFGQFGYPLPWGISAAMDYYLSSQGHVQG